MELDKRIKNFNVKNAFSDICEFDDLVDTEGYYLKKKKKLIKHSPLKPFLNAITNMIVHSAQTGFKFVIKIITMKAVYYIADTAMQRIALKKNT